MGPRRLAGIAVALAGLVFCAGAGAQMRGDAQRAWFDTETGQLGAPPVDQIEPLGEGGAADGPLVVEPGRTSAGGIMIDLTGRPLYALEATLTPEGTVVTDCIRQDD